MYIIHAVCNTESFLVLLLRNNSVYTLHMQYTLQKVSCVGYLDTILCTLHMQYTLQEGFFVQGRIQDFRKGAGVLK